MVHKTYKKMVPHDEDGEKSKPPSLNRLMKTRLEKLVSRKDAEYVLGLSFACAC